MGSAFTLAHLGLVEASGPFGSTHLLLLGLTGVLGVAVVWDVLLTPIVVPLVLRAFDRLEPGRVPQW